MILVNLLRNTGADKVAERGPAAKGTFAGTAIHDASFDSPALNVKGISANLGLVLLLPVALVAYEKYNIGNLTREKAGVVQTQTKLEKEIAAKKKEISSSSNLQERAKELVAKLDIITHLSKLRLREVKALDYVQSIIPEKVWLKSAEFKLSQFILTGSAVTDDDLTQFVRGLENSAYFTNVILLQAKETKSKEGTVKVFEVSCTVENID